MFFGGFGGILKRPLNVAREKERNESRGLPSWNRLRWDRPNGKSKNVRTIAASERIVALGHASTALSSCIRVGSGGEDTAKDERKDRARRPSSSHRPRRLTNPSASALLLQRAW